MPDSNGELRAVFLAMIMVTSMGVANIALGGTAAASSGVQSSGNTGGDVDTDAAIASATDQVSSFSSELLGQQHVVGTSDEIPTTVAESAAVSEPAVVAQGSRTATVRLYTWQEAQGMILEWEVAVDTDTDEISSQTATVVERGVGAPESYEGYRPATGAVVVNDTFETGVTSQTHGGPHLDISNNHLLIDESGSVQTTDIQVRNWNANTDIEVTVTVDGNTIADQTAGDTLTATTDGNGDATVTFQPNPDAYSGRAVITVRSANGNATQQWAITDPDPTNRGDTNPNDDERGLLTIVETETVDVSAGGETVAFNVSYTDQNIDANDTSSYVDEVTDSLRTSHTTQIDQWGFDGHVGSEFDADGEIPVTITDGVFYLEGTAPGTYAAWTRQGSDEDVYIGWSAGPTSPARTEDDVLHIMAHEHFHLVQYSYADDAPFAFDRTTHDNDWYIEGQARFIETVIDSDQVHDPNTLFYASNVNGVNGYVENPQLGIANPEQPRNRSYDYALLWGYMYDRDGGFDTIEQSLEQMNQNGGDPTTDGTQAISNVLASQPGEHDSYSGLVRDYHRDLYRATNGNQSGIFVWEGEDWGEHLNSDLGTQSTVTFDGTAETTDVRVYEWGLGVQEVDPGTALGTENHIYVENNESVWMATGRQTATETDLSGVSENVSQSDVESTLDNASEGGYAETTSGANLLSIPPIDANNTVTNLGEYEQVDVLVSRSSQQSVTENADVEVSVTTIPENNHFEGTLEANESAVFVIPTNVIDVYSGSVYEYNGDVFVAAWANDSTAIDAELTTDSSGAVVRNDTVPGTNQTRLTGTNNVTETNRWVLTVEGDENESTDVTIGSNYLESGLDRDQMYTLPSAVNVRQTSNLDLQAGEPDAPGQVTFDLDVTAAGQPYDHEPSAEPTASNLNVTVGNERVPDANLSVSEVAPGRYLVRFTAPEQNDTGTYDLSVAFTDEKFGVENTARTELGDAVGYSEGGGSGAASVSLVIDRSGSMRGSQIDDARTAAQQFLSPMSPSDSASIVSYASSSQVDYPMSRIRNNETAMQDNISAISAGGSTNIGAGLIDGRDELDTAPNGTSGAAVLMSDGYNNRGYTDREVIDIADTYADSGYCIYTISFGSSADEQLMQAIANQSCGDYYTASNGTVLQEIYQDLQGVTSGDSVLQTATGTVSNGTAATNQLRVDSATDTVTLSVSIDSQSTSSSVTSGVTASSGSEQVELYYPNGTRVTLNNTTATGTDDPNITYQRVSDTTTYQILNDTEGEWEYRVNNTNGSDDVAYESEVRGSTRATVTVTADATEYQRGSTVELQALVTGPQGGLSNASVRANVTLPDGNRTTVSLSEAENGRYVGSLQASQAGSYTATVSVERGNLTRERTLSWSALNASELLDVNVTDDATSPAGGEGVVTMNVTRPGSAASSSASAPATAEATSDFESAAHELSRSSPEEIESANVSDALQEAALAIRNDEERDVDGATSSATAGAGQQSASIYVRTTDLTGPQGERIDASDVTVNSSVLDLSANQTTGLSVTVSVPSDAEPGEYNGTIRFIMDQSVVEQGVTVTVTEADSGELRAQIANLAQQWQSASPTTKTYYETQIADRVTEVYFGDDTGDSSGNATSTQPRVGGPSDAGTAQGARP